MSVHEVCVPKRTHYIEGKTMKHLRMISQRFIKLSLSLVMFASMSANAAPIINGSLGLTSGNPDIQSNFLNFDYSASSNTFDIYSLFGGAQLTLNGTSQNIFNSSFSISGTADSSNADLALEIAGELTSGSGIETLLTGTLTSMSNSGTGVMEFIFGSLGGSLQSLYGSQAGVIFTDAALSGYTALQDFSTSMSGNSDTFGLPPVNVSAPSTLLLSFVGLVLVVVARRQKATNA